MRSALSSLETDIISIQDNLPEEVIRQLLVEESWAHRNVLADLINAERLQLYASRRALLRPDRLKTQEPQRQRALPASPRSVVPFRGRKASA